MEGNQPTLNDLSVVASGTFSSRMKSIDWKVEILRWAEQTYQRIDMTFPGDEPLEIEWDEARVEEALQGSRATVRVISTSDRVWTDLYTLDSGMVVMRVYRRPLGSSSWALHWTGRLDTEFYEEPYEERNGYVCTLVFTDLGAWERTSYTRPASGGEESLASLLFRALRANGMMDTAADGGGVFPAANVMAAGKLLTAADLSGEGSAIDLGAVTVSPDNFFDEEGEPLTWRETVAGALQPLGLRIMQRGGRVWVMDWPSMLAQTPEAVEWSGESQSLGTGVSYQDMRVTFSPYPRSDYNAPEEVKGTSDSPATTYYSNALKVSDYGDPMEQNACIYTSFGVRRYTEGTGLGTAPQFQKSRTWSEFKGIAGSVADCTAIEIAGSHQNCPNSALTGSSDTVYEALRTAPVYVNGMGLTPTENANAYRLNIRMQLLLDPRYNPFRPADEGADYGLDNSTKAWKLWQDAGMVMMPVMVEICSADGTVLRHYDNTEAVAGYRGANVVYDLGDLEPSYWKEGAGQWGCCWMMWYPDEITKESVPTDGWSSNRQPTYIRCTGAKVIGRLLQGGDGWRVKWPTVSGWLRVRVGAKVCVFYKGKQSYKTYSGSGMPWCGLASQEVALAVKWWAMRRPEVTVESAESMKAPEDEDVEYTGWLNATASESLEAETICGSVPKPSPHARGLYRLGGSAVTGMSRSGGRDCLERMMMGLWYSQYAGRLTTLSGEAYDTQEAGAPGTLFTDAGQGSRLFLMTAETEHCGEGTADLTLTEAKAEHYDAETEGEQQGGDTWEDPWDGGSGSGGGASGGSGVDPWSRPDDPDPPDNDGIDPGIWNMDRDTHWLETWS